MKSAALHREWSLKAGDTAAVPGLRHLIMNTLRRVAQRDADLWSAEIVVAELLSNVVSHTTGPASVSLSWEGDHPLLRITDAGPSLPQLPGHLPADTMSDSGRGLYLVSSLALDVQVAARERGGSQVSVMLDLARPA